MSLPKDVVCECHGSFRDGSIVLYGDRLPRAVDLAISRDFGPKAETVIDMVLVMGTSLQVAPFCAIPNLAPAGCTRVLVNRCLADCCANTWSKSPANTDDGLYGHSSGAVSSTKLAGRMASLRPRWRDSKGSGTRWQQCLIESDCDEFVARFFKSARTRRRASYSSNLAEARARGIRTSDLLFWQGAAEDELQRRLEEPMSGDWSSDESSDSGSDEECTQYAMTNP
uniref:Deacetylase sirtuin-type domain-containing protein n=1 Tax=Haptolina brevifila TaxID=156173 RepID=A0A7S2J0D6_9EUKA